MGNTILGALVAAMAAIILMLCIHNSALSGDLALSQASLAAERASSATLRASIDQQNKQIRDAKEQSLKMKVVGETAMVEAEKTITALNARIEQIRRAPKVTTCEEVRIRMIEYTRTRL